MPDISPFIPAPDEAANYYGSALDNPSVTRCCVAAHRAFLSAVANGKPDTEAEADGAAAFRRALPALDNSENVRDFISCIAHGALIRAIEPSEAPRLLYAAQCAVSLLRRPPGKPNPV